MIRWTGLGAASLAALLLTACQTGAPTDSTCLWDRPLSYDSKADTPETVAEIRSHNEALYRVCPALRPK